MKFPKNPFRENKERRIASEAAKREVERAEAQFRILQEQADKADAQRQSEERHKKIERHTWRKQAFLGRAQLKAAQRLNCITAFTFVLAIFGLLGGIAAVLATRTATIESNRAWMGLDAMVAIDGFQTKPEWELSAHYVIKNFGKGPALNVVSTSAVDTNPEVMGERGKTICNLAEIISSGSEPPKQFIRNNNPGPLGRILFPDQLAQEPITEEGAGIGIGTWHGRNIQGAKSIWVLGCIAYMDQFKAHHWTRFCVRNDIVNEHITSQHWCGRYNDTDETGRANDKLVPIPTDQTQVLTVIPVLIPGAALRPEKDGKNEKPK